MKKRLTVALIEEVVLENGEVMYAKIDTGADSSSIDTEIAKQLGEKKIQSHKVIKSALGTHRRPTINVGIKLQNKDFYERFSLSDRSHLKYKVLIGKDILRKEGFLVDPILKSKEKLEEDE
jgi:hypothetical protein